ncbi:MAG: DEAD/DEAH box helicase family protein [Oscillospiraceae bacterium]|nr:DEAD/DEAH box helicase family protein [Oscillospiraceae bacterium]
MSINEQYLPININESLPDSRSLIMPHQEEAVKAMKKYFKLGKNVANRSGLVVMPTGSGKTFTAVNWLMTDAVSSGYKVIWLVHRQELVEQTFQEFRSQAPLLKKSQVKKFKVLPVSGVHLSMSSARRADVYVCSIQSVANKYGYRHISGILGSAGKEKVVVVIDEAHHAVNASYQKVLNRIRTLNPNMVLLGLTATPYRMNESEQRKLQSMFNVNKNISKGTGVKGFVYEVTLKQLLTSGFLADPKYKPVYTEITGELEYGLSAEDQKFFNKFGELSERLKNQIAKSTVRNDIILNEYLDNKDFYGKTIVFAVNQIHAETLSKRFNEAGIPCDFAVSSRPDAQNVIKRFKDNEFKVLINVQILTEGSDVPDIQTVFLTRQTNSDSLLMQMIGRGLRGEEAGGTKTANIVAFHDSWNVLMHWIDPGTLDIFEDEESEDLSPDGTIVLPEIEPNQNADKKESDENTSVNDKELAKKLHEIYIKLYESAKASVTKETGEIIFPVGWYTISDVNAENHRLLVFDSQEQIYQNISSNISLIVDSISAQQLLEIYFENASVKPDVYELNMFLDYINDTGEMPEYYSFEERDRFDPSSIAKIMLDYSTDRTKQELWLEELYKNNSILEDIYRYFFAFKKTVFDTLKEKTDTKLIAEDERQEYNIIPDYFNLNDLLKEVLEMYPKLTTNGLVMVAWSNDIVRDWFGLCVKYPDGTYQIRINKVLSSPSIDKEIIKYLLFHELLHQNGYWDHDDEFRSREWQYPDSAELDSDLDSLRLKYNLEEKFKDSVSTEFYEKPTEANTSVAEENEPKPPVFNKNAKGVQSGFKYCRNCGNKLPETAKFCDKCGEKTEY